VTGQLHAPTALFPGEEYPITIQHVAVWVSESVWTFQRQKNLLSLTGNRTAVPLSPSD
jgi:hypothetical protein